MATQCAGNGPRLPVCVPSLAPAFEVWLVRSGLGVLSPTCGSGHHRIRFTSDALLWATGSSSRDRQARRRTTTEGGRIRR